ncbi:MAG: PEP-CTERM sorting domain-containing protein [Sedimenticola sp.]
MKTFQKLLSGFMLLFVCTSVVHASLIRFDLTSDALSPSGDGYFEGYITFQSSDVFAGNTVQASSFLDWGFTWGSDLLVNASTPSAGFSSGADTITFDASAGITSFAICVSTPADCLYSSHPGFYADSSGTLNNTLYDDRVGVAYAWTRTDIPEPATIALLGLGLAGMGFARKKKAA